MCVCVYFVIKGSPWLSGRALRGQTVTKNVRSPSMRLLTLALL